MQPLNIAIIVGNFPALSETFIVNQVNSLIEEGHQVQLYSYKKGKHKQIHNSLKKHNLLNQVTYFNKPPISKHKRVIVFLVWVIQHIFKIKWRLFFRTLNFFKYAKEAYTLKLFFETQWFLITNNFDIVHVHFGTNAKRIAYIKSLGFLSKKTKLITTFHGYGLIPNNVIEYQKEYALLLQQSDAITVNSLYLKRLLKELKSNLKNTHILPVGLDTSYFKRIKKNKESEFFNIVFCGRLIEIKGPDIAVDVVNELHNLGYNKVRLHIIGEGRLRPLLKQKIEKFELQDYIFLYGALTQDQVKKRFEQADVFLLPGRYDPKTGRAETQGLVIQEAQAMGLPVVVSDVGGMQYGLLQNKTGFVIQENNVIAFAEAIEKLILNPDLKRNMGKKGAIFVRENFDNTVLLKKLLFVYYKALQDH